MDLTREAFAHHLNGVFAMKSDQGQVTDVVLVEATALGATSPEKPGRRNPFSLVFRGAPNLRWPQGLYTLSRDGLGEFTLFLVPIGPDTEGQRYEAIYN